MSRHFIYLKGMGLLIGNTAVLKAHVFLFAIKAVFPIFDKPASLFANTRMLF